MHTRLCSIGAALLLAGTALVAVAFTSAAHAGNARAVAAHPARRVDVRAVRLWAGPDNTRIVLDLSGSAQHSLAVMQNPNRVVLDVVSGRLTAAAMSPPAPAGAVRQVRMANRPGGDLRIVFDLSHPIRAKSFLARPNDHYGYRLVIDLGGASAVETPVRVEHARPDARDLIIAVDAGHGGEDPGAIGKNGTR